MAATLLHIIQQPHLEHAADEAPPAYSSYGSCKPEDPPAYTKRPKAPCSTSKSKSYRKSLHRHKTPNAYQDLPIFENPCPLCFLKHCRKVLKDWIRKQKKPFSAVTVQIDRLTSEQYEENVSSRSWLTYHVAITNNDTGSRRTCRPH